MRPQCSPPRGIRAARPCTSSVRKAIACRECLRHEFRLIGRHTLSSSPCSSRIGHESVSTELIGARPHRGLSRGRGRPGRPVPTLELVGIPCECGEISDAVLGTACREDVFESQRAERRVSSGGAAIDGKALCVGKALAHQRRAPAQTSSMSTTPQFPRSRRRYPCRSPSTSVVHVEDGEPARRPVLDAEVESVSVHAVGRRAPSRGAEVRSRARVVGVRRWVVIGVRGGLGPIE